MNHISQRTDFTNHKIFSYDKMIKIIVNLGSKKDDNNNNTFTQRCQLHNLLLTRVVDNTKKYLSHGEGKEITSKVRTYYVN